MVLFVAFIVLAVILGCGALLSPIFPTAQPRIGASATFALALIVGGAVFLTELLGWNPLWVDYLLFALVSFVVLGGTLSSAQTRAEARGQVLEDHEMGWPGLPLLMAFALAGMVFIGVAIIVPFPLTEHAAKDAFVISTATRGSDTANSLPFEFDRSQAPFNLRPSTPPGLSVLGAYLSNQLGVESTEVLRALGAILALLCVWTLYDVIREIRGQFLTPWWLLIAVFSLALLGLHLFGFYKLLLGIAFLLAFCLFAWRVFQHPSLQDGGTAGLLLGAILLSHTAAFFTGLIFFCTLWVRSVWQNAEPRWSFIPVTVPVVAALATSPWWIQQII